MTADARSGSAPAGTSDARRGDWPSVNARSAALVRLLIEDAAALRVGVDRTGDGCVIVDAGIQCRGGLEAGRRVAEICLAGLGSVRFAHASAGWPLGISVHTANAVLACLGSQYAGWSLAHGEGRGAFRALGSGPARALAVKEPLFAELQYRDRADATCLVLEVDRVPPPEIVAKVARDCGVPAERLTIILTPTRSLAGVVQIVARVLEVALHKAHAIGFALDAIVDGAGTAPLPPPAPDFVAGMGRTNDAILFGGDVQLFVEASDDAARDLAERLPSCTSRDYGKPFARVFEDCGRDFYRIDPLLFAPARVRVTNMASGRSFVAGRLDPALVAASFEGDARG